MQEEHKKELLATLKVGAKPAINASDQATSGGTGNGGKTGGNVMSMSVALGGRAVPFGKAGDGDVKNARNKATKQRQQQQQRRNNPRNYDDCGTGLP